MSTNAYTRPLYAVPNAPPSTKLRFATLLAIWDAARRAFDRAMSLPRSAIRWALDLFDRWVENSGSVSFLSWLSSRVRNAANLLQTVGVVPSALAVLSTPPIAAVACRAARFVGRGMLRVASAAWTGLKSLLARCGNTGKQISESLGRTGTRVASAARTVANHPMMVPVAQALKSTGALVRPISWGLVAYRLLQAVVPIVWLRNVIALLVVPFAADSTLADTIGNFVGTSSAASFAARTDDTSADLLINTGNGVPANGNLPSDADDGLNRAERRAQQREERRTQYPRR
jgi:hypothetical protein